MDSSSLCVRLAFRGLSEGLGMVSLISLPVMEDVWGSLMCEGMVSGVGGTSVKFLSVKLTFRGLLEGMVTGVVEIRAEVADGGILRDDDQFPCDMLFALILCFRTVFARFPFSSLLPSFRSRPLSSLCLPFCPLPPHLSHLQSPCLNCCRLSIH